MPPILTNRRSVLAGGLRLLGSTLLFPSCGHAITSASALVPPASDHSDLDFASALAAARAIRAGEVTSVELTTRMLERIKQFNPRLNAIVTLTEKEALARARAADEARTRDEWWGTFHGVPCTVKDSIETAGVRTTAGARFLADHVPARDATVVLATPKGPRPYGDLDFWISFATLTGLPATIAPVGITRDGLPVGLQIIGPYLEDATPIDLAGKLADLIGGFRPPKGY